MAPLTLARATPPSPPPRRLLPVLKLVSIALFGAGDEKREKREMFN